MKIYLLSIAMLLILTACGLGDQKSLFNGKDLTGWKVMAIPEDQSFNFWKVVEGHIEANSLGNPKHDYVWLMTEKEYMDFELNFKFQAFEESPGNSGIQVRSRYDESTYWLNGPQIDIHPSGYWRTGMMWDETRGLQRWIFPDLPNTEWVDSTMAIGQNKMYFFEDDKNIWNEMRVIVKGLHIESWLNGEKITDFDGTGILDDEFHQKLDIVNKGHIAFQIHSGDELKIWFKDIYIKEI